MTGKIEIVRRLGEQALLLPALLAQALGANDRIKLRLTLLQEASAHARNPARSPRSLEAERRAVGLDEARFDDTVAGARALSPEHLLVPGGGALVAGLGDDLTTMLAPILAAEVEAGATFGRRLDALAATLPDAAEDQLGFAQIDAMTAARHGGSDSVHRLVMDAHKAINRLVAETAVETIDGAHVHHVGEEDRSRIRAFMGGLNRTAPLAFGHPGLGTTATRGSNGLTIQNDIGTTDAHVLVVHVEGQTATVTYTDVHRIRAKFFISLFDGHGVEWSPLAEQAANALGEEDVFYLVVGRLAAPDAAALDRFLAHLGSRIVFLIDWNKGRKALQTFVGKTVAVDILTWAARMDAGHRAFLELGGADLVFEAVRHVAAGRIPYGVRLDETLGPVESADFLRRVLRLAAEGLAAGRSIRLIRDEVQADLAQLFDTAERAVIVVLVRHLGITRMLAAAIAEALADDGGPGRQRLAANAKRLEEKADRLTLQAREICARVQRAETLRLVVDEVENATDALDECAFLLSLAPAGSAQALAPAAPLAAIVIDSVGQMVRAAEGAAVLPLGSHQDANDTLQAIDAVTLAERRADTAERECFATFMGKPQDDARLLVLGLEVTRALEGATDRLAHAALALRERVLEELSA